MVEFRSVNRSVHSLTGRLVWQPFLIHTATLQPLGIANLPDSTLREAEVPVTGSIRQFARLILLLVFGSRPSDQTEGTFVGIGDATNMAVIP